MLSPQNASEVAGLLLKDSLQRNNNNPLMAAAEYIGGTDRSNWGPTTKAYVARIQKGLNAQPQAVSSGSVQLTPLGPGGSTFDRALAQQQEQQAPSQLQAIFRAYQAGQMTPEEQQQYEADVRSGAMMLPQGASLNTGVPGIGGATTPQPGTPSATPPQVPDGVLKAYANGQMTPQEMTDFEHDVRGGAMTLPPGVDQTALFGEPAQPKSITQRIEGAAEAVKNLPGAVKEMVTGANRRTAETDALPDWAGMPEMNQASWASFKSGLGTLLSNPEETAQILKANFPGQTNLSDLITGAANKGGVTARQDEKGNWILRSGVNGQEYAIKPGFQVSDIPRAIGGLLAFTPAGRASTVLGGAAAAGATQTAIEATKAATGGNFNPGDIAGAAVLGGAAPVAARVLGAVAAPIKAGVSKVLGRAGEAVPSAAESAAPAAAPAFRSPGSNPDAIHVAPNGEATMTGAAPEPLGTHADMNARAATAAPASAGAAASSVPEVAATARQAASGGVAGTGSAKATQELARMAAPNPETQAAAERLGITDYLQPDHVTTNDGYRQAVGVLKSNPTSQLALGEKEGLEKVAQRATNLIDEIGGTTDLSTLDAGVKARMTQMHSELSSRENGLWNQLRAAIPQKTDTPATNAMQFLTQRADELGGVQNLTPMEKSIAAKLGPKVNADQQQMLQSLGPAARQQAIEQGAGGVQPTYALVDDVRKDVGAAMSRGGPFTDADTGLAKKYYGLLTSDQEAVANQLGHGDLVQAAKAATTARKGLEDDLSSLFGKNLDQSIAPQLGTAMRGAAAGNTAPLNGMLAALRAMPDGMRQEMVASGVASIFRNQATRGEMSFTNYAKWFEGLQRNKQAFNAVMSNLPAAARSQLTDLYQVSKGISDSLAARIKTGLRSSVMDEMQAPDTLASRLFQLAQHAGKGLAADAVGGHGAGIGMALYSAIKGGSKSSAVKAVDDLLTSPEFLELARNVGTAKQAAANQAFAYSKPFTKFARAVGNPRELGNRERWVGQALQAQNNLRGQ